MHNPLPIIGSPFEGGHFGGTVRIAQALLLPAPRVAFEVAEQLTITERGAGGFGSTGQ